MQKQLDLEAGDTLQVVGEIVMQFSGVDGQVARLHVKAGEELKIEVLQVSEKGVP